MKAELFHLDTLLIHNKYCSILHYDHLKWKKLHAVAIFVVDLVSQFGYNL